jgi:hypothetical protein
VIDQRDTSRAAHEVQLAAFRRLRPSERAAIALQMSEETRELAAAGLRHRMPRASEAEIERALRRLLLGRELADLVDFAN